MAFLLSLIQSFFSVVLCEPLWLFLIRANSRVFAAKMVLISVPEVQAEGSAANFMAKLWQFWQSWQFWQLDRCYNFPISLFSGGSHR